MFAVIVKEIRVLLRSRKAFWFLLLALLAVGGIFTLGWVNIAQAVDTMNFRARIGRQLFMMFSVVQLCAMGLIAPLMTASSVTIERENKTMDLLIATGLSRFKMLLGKWSAAIFYELMLALCLLPILSLVFQLGGIGLDEYLFAASMIGLTVLTYGMLGLACSCFFRKSTTALFVTLVTILFLAGGLNILFLVMVNYDLIEWRAVEPFSGSQANPVLSFLFWSVSPIMTWVLHLTRLERSGFPGAPTGAFDGYLIGHMVFQAILFLIALRIAHLAILRRETTKTTRPAQQIDGPAELASRRRRWPFSLIDPIRRTREIADGRNPVFMKEQLVSALARPRTLCWTTLLCIPLSFFLSKSARDIHTLDFVFYSVGFSTTLIMLFVPIFAATMISREREEKTIDLLATTTLTAGQVVRAKFFIVLRFCAAITLGLTGLPLAQRLVSSADRLSGIMAHSTTFDEIFWDCLVTAGIIGVLVASFSALYTALCIFFSSMQRRNVGAIIISYITVSLLCALPIFGSLYYEIQRSTWEIGDFLKIPLSLFFDGVAPLLSHVYYLTQDSSYRGRHWYVFWEGNHFKSSWGDASLVLEHALLVAILVSLLLWLSSRRLRKEMN